MSKRGHMDDDDDNDDDDDDEEDLDALLGPSSNEGPGEQTRQRRPFEVVPDEERDAQLKAQLGKRVVQKRLSTMMISVSTTNETREEREHRLAQRKRERDEARAEKLTAQRRDEELKRDEEDALVAAVMERIHEAEKRAREERQRKAREEFTLEYDGTELPDAFDVDMEMETMLDVAGHDEVDALRRDALLSVPEYFKQDMFPVDAFIALATRRGRVKLEQCEFALVCNGAWWRKRRFRRESDLRSFIRTSGPERIELGPVHTGGPTVEGFRHQEVDLQRYLVFDVDMTDDDADDGSCYVRTCACVGTKNVCTPGCWFYMRVAAKVLVYLLRTAVGAEHLLVVYSGRRGIHVYALDERFVAWSSDDRRGAVERIAMIGRPWVYEHPTQTAYVYEFILKPAFYNAFLREQRGPLLVKSERCMRQLTRMMGEAAMAMPEDFAVLMAYVYQAETDEERIDAWRCMCDAMPMPDFERHFIFVIMYPRLDDRVTTEMNHCLKAPFCIHPATKRFSVPIPDIDKWGPHHAPRISDVLALPDDVGRNAYERRRADGRVLTPYVTHMMAVINAAYPLRPVYDRNTEIPT